jgi:hypothetical protein
VPVTYARRARAPAFRPAQARRSPAGVSPRAAHGSSAGMPRFLQGATLEAEPREAAGAPLDPDARADFEPRFGRDLGNIRVHTDADAAASAKGLHAHAFAHGDDIYFAAGQYRPDTEGGQRLIAHEVAHSVHQASAGAPAIQRQDETAPSATATPTAPLSVFPTVGPETMTVRPRETTADSGQARMLADEVYQALNGWNEEARALTALRGHAAGMRDAIKSAFEGEYHQPLERYLIEQLDGDWRVNALALLNAPTEWMDFAAMGRALLAGGTRDQEVLRLLSSRETPEERQQLAREYDQVYGRLGAGSLVDDIRNELWEFERWKAWTLLHRNLTVADEIFFDSVAISGTHDEAVVDRVEAVWREHGWTGLQEVIDAWQRNLMHAHGLWVPEKFTDMTFAAAMENELNTESWTIVNAHLTAQRQLATLESDVMERLVTTGEGATENEQLERENIELDLMDAIIEAAASGAGTNEAQIQHAISEIRRIWMARLDRVRDNPELLATYTDWWNERREELLAAVPEEMDEGTIDYDRTRLMLAGELTTADRIYLAEREGDNDLILQLATEAWARGQIDALAEECEQPRTARFGEEAQTIRPAFYLYLAVPVSHGDWIDRLLPLVNDESQLERGYRRLAVEIDSGTSDSDLQRARAFLTTRGLSADLRDQVVAEFERRRLGTRTEEGPNARFVAYVMERYEQSHAAFALQNLLTPSEDPTVLADRAAERVRVERGIEIHPALQGVALVAALPVGLALIAADVDNISRDIDAATGNDTEATTEESAARLRWIANAGRDNPEALADVMRREGVGSPTDLARREYGLFEERFEDWAALRAQVVETIATIIEIAVDLAIIAATGGGAGPLLLASIASTVAGIAFREGALGQNYDVASEENAQRLFMAAASAGLGGGAHTLAEGLVDVQRLSRLGTFAFRATTDAVTQIGVQTLQLSMSRRYPTTEDVVAAALSILGSSLGAGTGGALSRHGTLVNDAARRARALVLAEAVQNLMQGLGQEGGDVLRGGDLSAGEIADRLARRALRDLAQGTVSGLREAHDAASGTGAESTETDDVRSRRRAGDEDVEEAGRRRRAAETAEGEEEDPAGRRRAADGDPDAVDETATRRAAAPETGRRPLPRGEGVVAAARVNADHTISIIRTRDGRLFIVMCSDGCGRILQRIATARAHPTHEFATEFRLRLELLEDEVNALQTRLDNDPEDPELHQQLEELANDVDEAIEGFRLDARGARHPGRLTSERGETYVAAAAARRMLAEEAGEEMWEFMPDPFAGQPDRIAIGPSRVRTAVGEDAQIDFIIETLPRLEREHPDIARQFLDAVAHNSVERPGPPPYRWPVDTYGNVWQVHHALPLEWGGADNPSNYVALPMGLHSRVHRMWERLAARVREETGGTADRGGAEPGEQLEYLDPFED